ncbi:NAD(P)-binding domain-containing protein [Pelagicoccus albus]|uniref:NAD(P)/FAD-dependent oxidoreductase n=1 Tax=Pelagicoccus albus TaxID=415222 RepID=A0A7X1E9X4_9BACT|nr:NAD(P)-binding domain-containing protein [Pelagicoccus albus]MBC2607894.1 NAD(P)/FAD-dependent oxidoreductase [Pelagicoccus albus]
MPSSLSATPALKRLEEEIRSDRDVFSYYAKPWVRPYADETGQPILDVAIIGAGQNGLGCCYSLRCEGVTRIQIFDQNPQYQNGNFAQYTRMNFLRTPKDLCGLERGDPRLSFQRYYKARYGAEAWEPLKQSPRAAFADYLHWYSELLELPISYQHRLKTIEPLPDQTFNLHFETPDGSMIQRCRTVVLAGGSSADQYKNFPNALSIKASPERWAHGGDSIDFQTFQGKRVSILGHGAGAFDLAGTALEAGAAAVDIFYRRKKIPLVNPRRHLENAGMMAGFKDLPPDDRWKILKRLIDIDQPPPQKAFERIYQHPALSIHPGTNWSSIEDGEEGGVTIETSSGPHESDFAILATGFKRKPMERSDIQSFSQKIRTWESYQAPDGYEDAGISAFPDLGPAFEFQPKDEKDGWLRQIFNVSFGSGMNHGSHIVSVSGLQFTIPRLSSGIRDRLFLLDADYYVKTALAFDEAELQLPADQVDRFNAD